MPKSGGTQVKSKVDPSLPTELLGLKWGPTQFERIASARIYLVAYSFISFGLISVVQCSTPQFCSLNSCSRMRVGKHRVEFFIEEDTIFISRMFQRSGDSDYS